MKIVFVNPVGAIGGAEKALLTILAALRTTQPDVKLYLIVGTSGLLVETAQNLGVQVKVLQLPEQVNQLGDSALKGKQSTAVLKLLLQVATILPAIGKYIIEFRRAIREISPDLIHSNGIKTHLLTALAGKMGMPVVWHIHDFYGERPLMARILRWISDKAALGIAISEAVATDALATLPGLPIEVVYNAVDVTYFCPLPNSQYGEDKANLTPPTPLPCKGRGEPDSPLLVGEGQGERLTSPYCPHSPLRVGLVATFARWKGHDVFLDAAASISRSRPDLNVRFYIIGGPIYQTKGSQFSEEELRERASILHIEDKVEFLGFQQNVADIYRMLDIVVHASTQPEPFGLAIVEAMACGKPVIVSEAGGAAELFTHNYDAIGSQPGSSAALASAIQELVENPSQRQRLSLNARETVLKRFNHNRLGSQFLTLYSKLVPSL